MWQLTYLTPDFIGETPWRHLQIFNLIISSFLIWPQGSWANVWIFQIFQRHPKRNMYQFSVKSGGIRKELNPTTTRVEPCSNRSPHFQLIKTSSIAMFTVIRLEPVIGIAIASPIFEAKNSKIHRHTLRHHLLARLTVFFFKLIYQLTARIQCLLRWNANWVYRYERVVYRILNTL